MEVSIKTKEAIDMMFGCQSQLEHMSCFHHYYDELKEWTFIVFSSCAKNALPNPFCTDFTNKLAIINLAYANYYYAMNKQIYETLLHNGKIQYNVDVCIELDTQAVSYLKNVFTDYNKPPDFSGFEDLVDLLNKPSVNYSCIPYLVENKLNNHIVNKIECYNNIKSFNLLKEFDYENYLKNRKILYKKTELEITLESDALLNDIFSPNFNKIYKDYLVIQKVISILLSKAIYIEFSSKRSPKNKMLELFDFINKKLGVIMERELEVCYYYFMHHDLTKKFFKKVQKSAQNIHKTINNMAWDLVHIRMLEQQFGHSIVDGAMFNIHVLLTYDNGLKDILKINPIEQIAIYKGVSIVKFHHQLIDQIKGSNEILMNKETIELRKKVLNDCNMDELYEDVKQELENSLIIR